MYFVVCFGLLLAVWVANPVAKTEVNMTNACLFKWLTPRCVFATMYWMRQKIKKLTKPIAS